VGTIVVLVVDVVVVVVDVVVGVVVVVTVGLAVVVGPGVVVGVAAVVVGLGVVVGAAVVVGRTPAPDPTSVVVAAGDPEELADCAKAACTPWVPKVMITGATTPAVAMRLRKSRRPLSVPVSSLCSLMKCPLSSTVSER